MRAVGTLNAIVDNINIGTQNINWNSGGNLLKTKNLQYLLTKQISAGTPTFEVDGVLDVYGRRGTHCGDNATQDSDGIEYWH